MENKQKERAKKDLEKLNEIITLFRMQKFFGKYQKSFEFAENYCKDAHYYYQKKDYFSSFGCANYAYGILDGILLKEKTRPFHDSS